MNTKADLHIHTALSTFADPDLTPGAIVQRASELKLGMIGITDYNSTKQALSVKKVAAEAGIFVLTGVEVISSENVHALVYFEKEEELNAFQKFLDKVLPQQVNDTSTNGYQIIFDEYDEIIESENNLLFTPLNCKLSEISAVTAELNGIMIAAHIDREGGILKEFGCIPDNIKINALELAKSDSEKFQATHNHLKYYALVRGSAAKKLDDIGNGNTIFKLPQINFQTLRSVLSFNLTHDIIIF